MSALAFHMQWMRRLAHRLAWLSLALLALWLLLWTVLHVWIVPRIDRWREPVAQWASKSLGTEVRIERIDAHSTGWVPSFEFQNVRVMDAQGQQALHLPKVLAAISAPSLLQLDLAQLVFEAPALEVRRLADGRLRVAGWTVTHSDEPHPAWRDWLFSQKEVLVRSAQITWVDEQHSATPLQLTSVNAVLRNGLSSHRWRLDVLAPQLSAKPLVWMGQFRGPLLTLHPGDVAAWQGQTYLAGEAIDVGQLQTHLPSTGHVLSGQGSIKLWAGWHKGQWEDAALETQLKALRLRLPEYSQETRLDTFSARAAMRMQPGAYAVQIQDLQTQFEGQRPVQAQNLGLLHQAATPKQPQRRVITATALDLTALQHILPYLPVSAAHKHLVEQVGLRGVLKSLEARLDGPLDLASADMWNRLRAKGEISQFVMPSGTAEVEGRRWSWPGIESADIGFEWRQGAGRANVRVKQGAIFLPNVLEEARIPLEQLQASWQWRMQPSAQGLLFTVPQWRLALKNDDLSANLQGSWSGQSAQHPAGVLDATGQIGAAKLTSLHRYLPKTLPVGVRHYLRDAFLAGQAEAVQLRIKGPVDAMPFQAGGGEFRWQGRIRGAEMAYIPARLQTPGAAPWPAVLPLEGTFDLNRLSFQASLQQALARDWPDVKLSKVKLAIDDMAREPVLQLQSDWRAPIEQALPMLAQSAIGALLGGALEQTQAQGVAEGQLRLKVPLLHPEKSQVMGEAKVQAERLQFNQASPVLTQAQGRLRWSEQDVQLLDAQGFALGGPVKLEGGYTASRTALGNPDNVPSVDLRMQGVASIEGLRAAPQLVSYHPFLHKASGQAAYTARLSVVQGRTLVHLQSGLEGVALDWPAPLNKTAQQEMPLRIEQRLANKSGLTGADAGANRNFDRIDVRLGAFVQTSHLRELSGNAPRLLSGVIALGDAARPVPDSPRLPASGVTVVLAVAQLTVDPWLAFAKDWAVQAAQHDAALKGATSAATPAAGSFTAADLPSTATVQAQQLVWNGRPVHDVTANISREGALWRASVKANELDGLIEYRAASGQQLALLSAKLKHLHLPEQLATHVETVLQGKAESLPALRIEVDALQLRGRPLGRLDIEAAPLPQTAAAASGQATWQLRRLDLRAPEAHLTGQGQWVPDKVQQGQTQLDFVLNIEDAGALLGRMGMPDTLRRGEGKLDGNIVWDGSPLAPNVPSMRGQLTLAIGKGQFLQADPGAAKLLGVLSLQALPRRFVLDFRDVFRQGFSFDRIDGTASVQRGVVRTDNLRMSGVQADVTLRGSANLQQETQDIRAVIVPKIDAGGASVLAAVAVNPLAGLGTFIAQRILSRPLVKSNTQSFHIDGSWSEPRVTRLEAAANAAQALPPATPGPVTP
jgi:uncharacterized protein (TIGR02099 family)